ncbi:MAG: D-alanyl-D-alanine carboxypeptidase [Clostridiales bacterium]|nr:D-alanyl-D-alanine carboxypeptidase [Clostridiales bacterium]
MHKNRKTGKIISSLLTVLIAAACVIPFTGAGRVQAVVNQPDITITPIDDINCASYCVYDFTADEILMERQSHNRIYPASMTKIMTFQLGLDYLDSDAYVTCSENAINSVASDSTMMYLCVGEEIKVSELYYGLMLPSGNDAANVIGESVINALFENYPVGGPTGPDGVNAQYFVDALGVSAEEILASYPLSAFAELMTLRARNLGCTGTHFSNAHGYHSDDHYTTAFDLCIMMANATRNPDFNTVISSPTHVFQATNCHPYDGWSTVRNTNQILMDPWMTSKTADGEDTHIAAFIGGKTGTTSVAGTGMTTYSVNENGHELMIAVCGIPYEESTNQTRYVTSAVAYGNYACWNSDPVTVVPGTLGDYQRFNWTADEYPVLDTVIAPFDAVVEPIETEPLESGQEELPPGETAGEVIIGDAGDPEVSPVGDDSALGGFFETRVGKFISLNPGVSVFIAVLIITIIVLVVILITRSIKYSRPKRRKTSVRGYQGKGPTFQ